MDGYEAAGLVRGAGVFSSRVHGRTELLWEAEGMGRFGDFLAGFGRVRRTVLWLALVGAALWFGLGGAGSLAQTPEPPETILLIRHAEKPESGIDLAPAGFERAKAAS